MKRLTIALLILVFLIGMTFPGLCISQPKYGGKVVFAISDDMTAVDPHKTGENAVMRRICLVCNNLVESSREFEYKPALATSWDVSADAKEWTFHLRKGVKFHNGREMTAEDIKWNFDRMLSPKSFFRGHLGVVESAKVIDRYTVKVILKNPSRNFLVTLAAVPTQPWFIAPESENPDGSVTHPIGTGPFEFVEWKPGDHFTFKRFKDYWDKGLPYLDEVTYKIVPDQMVRLAGLRTGEIDIALRLPIEQVLQITKSPQKDLHFEFIVDTNGQIILNLSKPPFDNVKVRQALAYAINKNEMLMGVYYGHGEVSNQFFSKSSPWHCDVPDTVQDKEKAKALLKEAGYPEGLKVVVQTSRDIAFMGRASEIMQHQLKDIGMDLQLEFLDLSTLLGKLIKGDFALTVGGFPEYGDPDFFYRGFFHPKGQLSFFTGRAYNNPQVTAWLEEAIQVADFNKRKELYCKVIKTLHEEYPCIFIFRGEMAVGMRAKVKGYKPHINSMDRYAGGGLHYAWLE